jgi:polysaccharide export outer membrane protein
MELFRKGDYNLAAKYFDAANRYRDELSQVEQDIVDGFLEGLPRGRKLGKDEAPSAPAEAAPPRAIRRSDKEPERPVYVVEPPDLMIVDVLEAAPGRPISGERLVRPDGKISLGFYGEVEVAGLTIPEIKEKVVLHLRKFLSDETLGLLETDANTGESVVDPETGKTKAIDPKETDRVFVDVTAYNSANVYVEGEVNSPSRIPYTGGDTVLDLIHHVGGLLPSADSSKIRLIRSFPKGAPAQALPVNYEQITMGTDSSTNYAVLPNDRLVVPRDPNAGSDRVSARARSYDDVTRAGVATSDHLEGSLYYDRGREKSGYYRRQTELTPGDSDRSDLEPRIAEIEAKLDRLLEATAAIEKETAERPGIRPGIMGRGQPPSEMEEQALMPMQAEPQSRSRTPRVSPRSLPGRARRGVLRPSPGGAISSENRPGMPESPDNGAGRSQAVGRSTRRPRPPMENPSPFEPDEPEQPRRNPLKQSPGVPRNPFEEPESTQPSVPADRSPFDDDETTPSRRVPRPSDPG